MVAILRMSRHFPLLICIGATQVGVGGCSDDPTPLEQCESGYSHRLKDESCAGVTTQTLCQGTYCPDSTVKCTNSLYVSAKAAAGGNGSQAKPFKDLPDAAKVAKSGDCVHVGPGAYLGALFSGGVSILGAGVKLVSVSPAKKGEPVLAMSGGSGGVVRGLELKGGSFGLVLSKIQGIKIEHTRVSGAEGVGLYAQEATGIVLDHVAVVKTKAVSMQKSTEEVGIGVLLNKNSVATIRFSLLQSNGQLGLMTSDSSVDITSSAVVDNGVQGGDGSGGIVLYTTTSCKAAYTAKLSSLVVDDNRGVGITVAGPRTELNKVNVTKTRYGGGNMRQLSVQSTSSFIMRDSLVSESSGQGIVIDGSCVGENPEPIYIKLNNNTISKNMDRGVWLQNIKAPKLVVLENNTVTGNLLVGIGGTMAAGVQVIGGSVSTTKKGPLPKGDSSDYMGDAIQALSSSSFTIKGVSFSNNGRLSVIFDSSGGEVSQSKFSAKVPAVVVQNGSKGKVTNTGNKLDSGKSVNITEPSTKYPVDDKVQSVIAKPPIAQFK